jgi:hypothetical protein
MEDKKYYDVPAVSNSGMSYINPKQGGTPARYKKIIIDGEKTEEQSPSLENGKLIHLYVENPALFIVSDVERPTDMLASWVEEVYEMNVVTHADLDVPFPEENVMSDLESAAFVTRKDRYKSIKDDEKVFAKFKEGLPYLMHLLLQNDELCITSKQKEVVEACVDSLKSNPVAKSLLFDPLETYGDEAHNELAVYWEEEIGISEGTTVKLECKGLIDRLILHKDKKVASLIDLKTTSKPIANFQKTVEYYRYHRQLSWYMRAVLKFLEDKGENPDEWSIVTNIVAVETTGLHECFVFELSKDSIVTGMSEIGNLLVRIAYATHTNNWSQPIEAGNNGVITLDIKPDES